MPIDPAYRTPHGLTNEMRSALAAQGNAVLGTVNEDGSPHLTELLFLLDDDDRVLLPTPHNTRKLRNLQARPIATVFFNEGPGWVSCTGPTHILTGEDAEDANRRNRNRLLTESGHASIGRVLAEHEDTTIVVTPERWLSWNAAGVVAAVAALGVDPDEHPSEGWFKDLSAE
ncbi:MAG: pyridoxamine 5'-phosphate oxidase family protein [Acidimicrobiia bacterium]